MFWSISLDRGRFYHVKCAISEVSISRELSNGILQNITFLWNMIYVKDEKILVHITRKGLLLYSEVCTFWVCNFSGSMGQNFMKFYSLLELDM